MFIRLATEERIEALNELSEFAKRQINIVMIDGNVKKFSSIKTV